MTNSPFLSTIITIAQRDLQAELRTRQLTTAMGLFAVLGTAVFYFTLESRPDVRLSALPAILWVIITFTTTLGLSRSLGQEADRGSLDALLMAPIERSTLYYGKLISTWVFSLIVAVLVTLLIGFLFNVGYPLIWWLILLLGTLGLSAIGTLLGSMTMYAAGRETTLPILLLPVALPILMAAVSASNAMLAGSAWTDWSNWPALLIVCDLLFLFLPLFLFEYVIEE